MKTFLSFISNVWTSEVEEIRLALEIRALLRLSKSKLNLSLSGPSDGTGKSSNDKDEHDGQSAKNSFHQFNADELAEEQASNRIGDANDDGDLSVSCMPFRTVFISSRVGLQGPNRMEGTDDADDFDFSEHSISSNDGGLESWRFGPSFTTHRMVFEICGYMLPLSVYNRKPTTS